MSVFFVILQFETIKNHIQLKTFEDTYLQRGLRENMCRVLREKDICDERVLYKKAVGEKQHPNALLQRLAAAHQTFGEGAEFCDIERPEPHRRAGFRQDVFCQGRASS